MTERKHEPDLDATTQRALEAATNSFYAAAGAADMFYEIARQRLTKLAEQQAENRRRRERQAKKMRSFVEDLPGQARDLPNHARDLPGRAAQQADSLRRDVEERYGELTGRGRRVIDRLVAQAQTTAHRASETAKGAAETVREAGEQVAERVDPLVEQAEEAIDQARTSTRRAAAGRAKPAAAPAEEPLTEAHTTGADPAKQAAKKAPAKKAAAKKTAAKKAAAHGDPTATPPHSSEPGADSSAAGFGGTVPPVG